MLCNTKNILWHVSEVPFFLEHFVQDLQVFFFFFYLLSRPPGGATHTSTRKVLTFLSDFPTGLTILTSTWLYRLVIYVLFFKQFFVYLSFFLSQVKITYPGVNTDTICLKKLFFFRRIVFTFMNKTPLKEKGHVSSLALGLWTFRLGAVSGFWLSVISSIQGSAKWTDEVHKK